LRARTVLQSSEARRYQPSVVVTLSAQATLAAGADQKPSSPPLPPLGPPEAAADEAEAAPEETGVSSDGLTDDERAMVAELAQRDRAVHAHEAAHQAAGGGLVGAASFTYEVGPDGRSYAIGGECPIQISVGQTPGETVAIAERVRNAALAPADPSPQDLAVANAATQMEMQARAAELRTVAQPAAPAAPPAGAAMGSSSEPSPAPVPELGPAVGSSSEPSPAASPELGSPSASSRDVEAQLLMDGGAGLSAPPSAVFASKAMAVYAQTAQLDSTVSTGA
jgi:hypothetical protein